MRTRQKGSLYAVILSLESSHPCLWKGRGFNRKTNCLHPQNEGLVSDIRFVKLKGSAHMQFVNRSQPTWRRHEALLFAKATFFTTDMFWCTPCLCFLMSQIYELVLREKMLGKWMCKWDFNHDLVVLFQTYYHARCNFRHKARYNQTRRHFLIHIFPHVPFKGKLTQIEKQKAPLMIITSCKNYVNVFYIVGTVVITIWTF